MPSKFYPGNLRQRRTAAGRAWRQNHPEHWKTIRTNERLKFRVRVLNHYGGFCHHRDAVPGQCSSTLQLHHVNHDGAAHREVIRNTVQMYRFVWKVVSSKRGYQRDPSGKKWVESDFTILCHIHNMKEHWNKSKALNL